MRNYHEEDFARPCSGRDDRRGFCHSRQCADHSQADRRAVAIIRIWGFGGGISSALAPASSIPASRPATSGGCYTAYRKVLIPNIGIVMKKTLVCG